MAYRIGYCPQTGEQIMVQDTNGDWNAFKSNFRHGLLVFADGTKMTANLSATALSAPDFATIERELSDRSSEIYSAELAAWFTAKGTPVSFKEKTRPGGEFWEGNIASGVTEIFERG